MTNNLCKLALQANGSIQPLFFNSTESGHTGLTNPSILIDGDDFYINLRNVQYALYHSEYGQNFQNHWGCLAYLNPEDDITLRTRNYLSKNNLSFKKIDTSKLDVEPLWEFIGLEDGRLVKWDGKLYLCGVRRDTTTNGVGRMELSELRDTGFQFVEVKRYRIEPPSGYTYCEKNWMPILDMPFHFVKWTNPTEVVKVDINTLTSETIVLKEQKLPFERDLRGGSQVIKYKDYFVAITHEVDLWMNSKNNKDAHYYHRFIVWDKDWNIVNFSDEFKFMDCRIEFSCGLAHKDGRFLITFGIQDTTAFLLEMTDEFFESFIEVAPIENYPIQTNKLNKFISETENGFFNFDLGLDYFNEGHYASAMTFFLRSAELEYLFEHANENLIYPSLVMVSECLGRIGRRRASQKTALLNAVAYLPNRYEAHYLLSQFYEREQDYFNCFASAKMALSCFQQDSMKLVPFMYDVQEYQIKFQIAYCAWWVGRFDYSRKTFFEISNQYGMSMDEKYRTLVQNNITRLGSGDKFLSYTSNDLDRYVYKFNDIEKIQRNYSQTYQDMFVLFMSEGKKNGTYIEIGSADPEYGSNTKLLESVYDWKGVGIEILEEEVVKHKSKRKNPVICTNALDVDYEILLNEKAKEYDNDGFFDYLQVDCEPPIVSFQILQMIPFDKFKFGVVTFEHDYYADLTKSIREESRAFMRSKGYILVIGNVSMNDDCPYEDWWVHKDYKASSRIMKILNDESQVVNMEKFMFQHK
jgi:tetratricopeptide (TPR) repeat protein